MTLHADLYWSFRSPYSYLAIGRYVAMTGDYDLEIDLKPVYPLETGPPDPLAEKFCRAVQGTANRRKAECCSTTSVEALVTANCVRMLTFAL